MTTLPGSIVTLGELLPHRRAQHAGLARPQVTRIIALFGQLFADVLGLFK
jgi:hypothetical protein